MPPTCAACMQPILGRATFVITGTEVVHKTCARAGMSTELSRALAELASVHANRAETVAQSLSAVREATEATARVERKLELTRTVARAAHELVEKYSRRIDELHRALDAARRDRDTAIQQRDTAQQVPVARTPPPVDTPEPASDIDSVAARFALMELD